MTQETEREAFDHWVKNVADWDLKAPTERDLYMCWWVWQARARVGKGEVDVRLLDDAITLITKSLAGMLTDTSFASPYVEDHRPRTPSWVMTHFIRDRDRRVQYVNDIKQRLDWIRNATEKARVNHIAALSAKPVEVVELALALQPYCFDGRAQSKRAAQAILAKYDVREK